MNFDSQGLVSLALTLRFSGVGLTMSDGRCDSLGTVLSERGLIENRPF